MCIFCLNAVGQISAQRAILTVKNMSSKAKESVDSFIEEAVIRRELSDNFCFYNPQYDSVNGTNDWARKTLNDHRYVYCFCRNYLYFMNDFIQ